MESSSMRTHIFNILLTITFLPLFAHSELFRNAYMSFELPPNWQCKIEGTEWVCISKYSQRSKEAIIILTAKEKGPTDSLKQYEDYLKQKKPLTSKQGKQLLSHVYAVKQVQINGHPWVDGLHINSEVENYYSRYLATTKDSIAVLITFSGHKQHYTKYSADFYKAIQSLRVIPPQIGLAKGPNSGNYNSANQEIFGGGGSSNIPLDNNPFPEENVSGFSESQQKIIALALLLAAVGFYLIRKRKKG